MESGPAILDNASRKEVDMSVKVNKVETKEIKVSEPDFWFLYRIAFGALSFGSVPEVFGASRKGIDQLLLRIAKDNWESVPPTLQDRFEVAKGK